MSNNNAEGQAPSIISSYEDFVYGIISQLDESGLDGFIKVSTRILNKALDQRCNMPDIRAAGVERICIEVTSSGYAPNFWAHADGVNGCGRSHDGVQEAIDDFKSSVRWTRG